MLRRLRRFFQLLLLLIIIFCIYLGYNTYHAKGHQLPVGMVSRIKIDDAAPGRLAQAVQFATVSAPTSVDTSALLNLDTFLQKEFPLCDSLLERTTLNKFAHIYCWKGQNANLPPILLTAHQDVVPVEGNSLTRWTENPYGGKISGGMIWGRGTLDDKVSVMGIMEATESLLREGFKPQRTIYLAFGHDEEVSGLHGAKTIAKWFADKNIHFEYVLDEGGIVMEKAFPGLESPLAMIGITEKGYVSLQLKVWLNEGGHSSMPPAQTAIGLLSKAVANVEEHPFPARIDGAVKGMFTYLGPELSFPYNVLFTNLQVTEGILKMQLGNKNTTNAMMRTTIAPTIIQGGVKDNVLPTEAKAVINFRILPGETVQSVKDHVIKSINDPRVKVSLLNPDAAQNPSKVSSSESFGFKTIQKTTQQIFPNVVVAPFLVIGATDGRHYQSVCNQIFRFLPLQIQSEGLSRIHGIDERVSKENYLRAIRFYVQLIKNSGKSE